MLLKVEGAGIEEQCVIKLIGIRMDNKMSFHLQAIEVTKQVNNRLFNLRKLWELATMEMMNLTAQSMLMSKMFYQQGWDAEKAWMAEHWKSSETSNLLLDGKGSLRESCPFYEDMIACNVSNYSTSRQGHLLWLITSSIQVISGS